MASKIPPVLTFTGLGLAALGGILWYYQHQRDKADAAKAEAQQAQTSAQPKAAKIPITVFADEGVPRAAPGS